MLELNNVKTVREYSNEYGKIYIEIYDDAPLDCVFTHLYVDEKYRNQGHGKQILLEAEQIARDLGTQRIFLKVEKDSWIHQWYLGCGYQYWSDDDDDYVWLYK